MGEGRRRGVVRIAHGDGIDRDRIAERHVIGTDMGGTEEGVVEVADRAGRSELALAQLRDQTPRRPNMVDAGRAGVRHDIRGSANGDVGGVQQNLGLGRDLVDQAARRDRMRLHVDGVLEVDDGTVAASPAAPLLMRSNIAEPTEVISISGAAWTIRLAEAMTKEGFAAPLNEAVAVTCTLPATSTCCPFEHNLGDGVDPIHGVDRVGVSLDRDGVSEGHRAADEIADGEQMGVGVDAARDPVPLRALAIDRDRAGDVDAVGVEIDQRAGMSIEACIMGLDVDGAEDVDAVAWIGAGVGREHSMGSGVRLDGHILQEDAPWSAFRTTLPAWLTPTPLTMLKRPVARRCCRSSL